MAISILAGIVVAYQILIKKYSRDDAEIFIDTTLPVIIFSVIGARLFYVIGAYKFYFQNPFEIIMVNHGGLSVFGAIVFGIIAFLIYANIKKLDKLKFLDIYALVMPLSQSIGRWGNYFNQEAFGAPYSGFLKLYVEKMHRPEDLSGVEFFHPTFLYESILDFLLFIFLFVLFFKKPKLKKGTIFYLYLMFYCSIRFFIENIRIDSVINIFNMPVAQILCILGFVCSLILFLKNSAAK